MMNTAMIGRTRNIRAGRRKQSSRDTFFDKARSPFQFHAKGSHFLSTFSKNKIDAFTSDKATKKSNGTTPTPSTIDNAGRTSPSWRSTVESVKCYPEDSKLTVPRQACLHVDNQLASTRQREMPRERGPKHRRTNNVDFRSILPTLECRPFDKDNVWSPDDHNHSFPSIDAASNEESQSSQTLQLQLCRDVRKYLRSLGSREDPLHFIDAPLFPCLVSVEAALAMTDSTVVRDLRKQCLMFLTMTKRLRESYREQVFLAMKTVAEELLQEVNVFCRERLHETSAKFMAMVYSDEITNWFLPAYERALWRISGLVGIQQVVLNNHNQHSLTDTVSRKIMGNTHGIGVYWEFAHHSSYDNDLLNKVMISWLGRHWHNPYLDENDLRHLVVEYELDSVAVGAWHRNAVLNVVAPVRELDIALLSMVGEGCML